MTRSAGRCRKHNEPYEYKETRTGGYNGAFSPLVRGEYHFYQCPHGCRMADPSTEEIRETSK